MVDKYEIPKAELKDPEKFYEKGFSGIGYLKDKEFKHEASRYLEGFKVMKKKGIGFLDLRPFAQGMIMGLISMGKNSKDSTKEKYANLLSKQVSSYLGVGEHPIHNSVNLEKKVAAGVFGMLLASGLYFGIGSLTAAVIGLSKASSSFLGIVLFIGGSLGLYFSLKK